MRSRGFGRIVNVGTNLFQNPVVPYHDYTAAKAALLSLTRTAAHDLGPDGITVNMVSGGLLRTTDASAADAGIRLRPDRQFHAGAARHDARGIRRRRAVLPVALGARGDRQNLIVDGGLVKG